MSESANIEKLGSTQVDHLLQAASKRIRQCIGTTGGHRETLAGIRARVLGEHTDNVVGEAAPERVRHDIEELNQQITILQEQQELVGQHIDALMQL